MSDIPPRRNTVLNRITSRYFSKWPYFLLAAILSFICAFTYLQFAKPVYEIKAILVIKDKDKLEKDKTDLQEIDLANPAKKVEIEIEVLKSRKIITKVLNDLRLWSVYKIQGDSKNKTLYAKSPITFEAMEALPIGKFDIDVKILNQQSFEILSNSVSNGIFTFNTVFSTKYGFSRIMPTRNLNQYIGETIKVGLQDSDGIISSYQSNYEARLVDKQQPVIELSIRDENIDRGKDFLNTIVREYNNTNTNDKNTLTKNTLAFIDKRLDSLSGELVYAEKNIEGFKSSRGITDITSESNSYLQSMQSNDTRLNEVNVQLKVINGIENYVNSPGNNSVPATLGVEDKGLISLIDQLAKLQLERNKLLATTPETNYLFEPINRQIESSKEAIRENVKNIKSSLLNIKSGLQTVNNKVESSIRELPGQERGYVSKKRQQGIKENLYTYLLQKREEVALSYASILTDVNVIDKAYVDSIIWPKKPFVYALALFLALSITAGAVFSLDVLRSKTGSVDELEEILGTSVLCELVYVKTKNPIVVIDPLQAVITQQFRALRISLGYLQASNGAGRVSLITSSKRGEGKSFVTGNLGASIAASGKRTIIIDMDLHKHNLSTIFGFGDGTPGVSNYLLGEASLEDIIHPLPVNKNLFIIPCGAQVGDPSELIESALLEKLIQTLKTSFQDIILDTPPIRLISDAYTMSVSSDLSLYIVRRGITTRNELNFIKRLYKENKLPKLNVIFNSAPKGEENVGY